MRFFLVLALLALSLGAGGLGATADEPLSHTVRWGESLLSIAHKYGVSANALVQANQLRNPNLVYAGQRLIIPGAVVTEYSTYTVQRGDNLTSIAARFGVSIWDLAARNNIRNTNLLFVGQTLVIPIKGTESPTPAPTVTATPTPSPTPTASSDVPVVQEELIIAAPARDADVTSPVTVTGWGRGFENSLAVDIFDENGETIGQGYVTIDAELGQIGPFTGTVEFTAPASAQMGRISVYSISPRDGAIEHLTSVSVNLQPGA
ncbi:MAG: LysM peptidoglycan-binding domain-containing protein [Anaerolineae bacterium]